MNKNMLNHFDKLTNTYNFYKLYNDINNENKKILLIIDIVFFSNINKYYGYSVGNEILKFVSNKLNNQIKKIQKDYNLKSINLYRMYADKFSILIENDLLVKNIEQISNILINEISNLTYNINQKLKINIKITIGASSGKDFSLINSSENALILAKHINSKFYYDELTNKNNNINLLNIIQTAIDKDLVYPVYQKIIDNTTHKVHFYEALMRLNYIDTDDKEKTLSPDIFLKFSKKMKMYDSLTKIMLKKIFNDIKKYKILVSINLTFEDIMNKDIVFLIKETVLKYKIGDFIIFEIIESEKLENHPIVISFLKMIKLMGCKLAIDDFGSGYSNYDQLLDLDIDYLKIDGAIVNNLDNKKHFYMLKSIIDFCKNTNVLIVAEYIDSDKKHQIIKDLGIEYSQGFLFGEPSKIENIEMK